MSRTTIKNFHWDIAGLVEAFGGNVQLVRLLKAHGFTHPSVKAIEAWKTRNSVPAHRVADLLKLAEEMRIDLDPIKYVKER